jgi:hypothetical protein
MRATAKSGGVSVKAYAGTTGVLLAMDVTAAARRGLLGFAIERNGPRKSDHKWLNGLLDFPGRDHPPGQPVETSRAPIQKFRWSDYTVFPDKGYRYTVRPMYGTPADPRIGDGPSVKVTTESVARGEHGVIFNRAAAASQAFTRDFPEVDAAREAARKAKLPLPQLPPRALDWLTRGVLEQILRFIADAAKAGDALDIAIYEYELPEIIAAVDAAAKKTDVRIVYHAKPGDPQTAVNRAAAASLPESAKRERVTNKIHHHKFIVRSSIRNGKRTPKAVLCGSTNFTENGVYRQGNVVHVVRRTDVAANYLGLFEVLFRGDDVAATKAYIDGADPIDKRTTLFTGFSPRSKKEDLARFAEIVGSATSDVMFCTAFDLFDDLEAALLGKPGDPILRYGVQNSRSKITGFHADVNAEFDAVAMLNKGLEGFLKETTKGQRGNILIHTKLIVVDFTSARPTVISGSHNLSASASGGNDENFLIIRGDRDIADCYGVELMRLYDHYRFRNGVRTGRLKKVGLSTDDSWTEPYFTRGDLKRLDRLRFAGRGA